MRACSSSGAVGRGLGSPKHSVVATWRTALTVSPRGFGLRSIYKRPYRLRVLDKWAVLIGGGENHRMGLYDMLMIKDNHVAAAGGITAAVARARE